MWLVTPDIAAQLRALSRAPDPGLLAEYNRVQAATASNGRGNTALRIEGGVAFIPIAGLLTERRSFLAFALGIENTSYQSIREAVAEAERNKSVREIVFEVNSGGGAIEGLFETVAALESISKRKGTRATLACSAAYALAAVGGPVEPTSDAATFGSIGVVGSYLLDKDVVDVTSTDAPNKRPDPSTPQGKATIREYLDQVHGLFVGAIARGRGTTAANVNANYGRGGLFVASEAKKRGMIDFAPRNSKPTSASAFDRRVRPGEDELEHSERLCAFLDARKDTKELPGATNIAGNSMGDKVAEQIAAQREGREPAAWARAVEANRTDAHKEKGDMGDRVAALFARGAASANGASEQRDTPYTGKDVGDLVAESFARDCSGSSQAATRHSTDDDLLVAVPK